MYPLSRLITITTSSLLDSKITLDQPSETTFYCRPWDLDMFMEMNNGRILTLLDLGRFNVMIRAGGMQVLFKNGWGLVVAGSSVRYRRRIRIFDKVTMRSQIIGHDDRWFYGLQSMWVKGQPCSSTLLRLGVTDKGKVIDPQTTKSAFDLADWNPELEEWVLAWIAAEDKRIWPPT